MMDRRSFFASITAAALGLSSPAIRALASVSQIASPGLKDLVPHNVLVGAVIDQWQMEDPRWLKLVLDNFNLITLGKLKWGFLRPTATDFDFRESDWMVDFCKGKDLALHGHNLCWNASNPDWLSKTLTAANAESMLRTHISTVMKRYAGAITSWDVVNEPIATWMGRSDGLYKGPWLYALGPAYIDIAFHTAAESDPTALRVLNIAHVEQGGKGCDKARAATLDLVEGLMKRGVPVQAIGFESHLAGDYPVDPGRSRSEFVKELRQFGLKVLLTELDVDDTQIRESTEKRDAIVRSCYGDYLKSVLPQAQPERIIFFTPGDQKNWYDALQDSNSKRRDGQPHRPGLVDEQFQPKPAYASVASALRSYRG